MRAVALLAAIVISQIGFSNLFSQTEEGNLNKKILSYRLGENESIIIDGILDDVVWGKVEPSTDYDLNYNAWSVDLGFKWYFSPGSELSVVWKNTLNSEGDKLPTSYFDNWGQMLEESFYNSLSIRALMYIDYSSVRSKFRRV